MDIAAETVETVWTTADVQIVVTALQLLCCFAILYFVLYIVKVVYRLFRIFF